MDAEMIRDGLKYQFLNLVSIDHRSEKAFLFLVEMLKSALKIEVDEIARHASPLSVIFKVGAFVKTLSLHKHVVMIAC